MEKNKPVLIFTDSMSEEGGEVFNLDKEGEGERFFSNLSYNVERNIDHKIKIEMWTQEQCDYSVKLGEYIAGDMTSEEIEAFDKLENPHTK